MTIAATIVSRRRHIKGSDFVAFLAFTGNYTALGESITAAQLGLNKLDYVEVSGPVQGTTHMYIPSVVPTSPDTNGRFTAFTLPILDLTYSVIAAGDLAAGAYPAALTGLTPGLYIRAVGF